MRMQHQLQQVQWRQLAASARDTDWNVTRLEDVVRMGSDTDEGM